MKKLKIVLGPNDPKPMILVFDKENQSPILTFPNKEAGFTMLIITVKDRESIQYIENKLSKFKSNSQNDCIFIKINTDPELGNSYAISGDYCVLNSYV